MSATDDLSELVERAGAAERAALASKWKDRPDVDALRRRVRRVLDEHRAAERRSGGDGIEPRREAQRAAFVDAPDPADPPADGEAVTHSDAARIERDAAAAVAVARLALLEAHLAVLD
ncbi:hypothetical protein AB0B41_39500, partial [Pseudonocardia sp. NPDC049154]